MPSLHKDNPIVECACGCGKTFYKFDSYGRPRTIIKGHNLGKTLNSNEYEECLFKLYGGKISIICTHGGTHSKGVFLCSACGHRWTARSEYVLSGGHGCPGKCRLASRIGATLGEFVEWIGTKKRFPKCKTVKALKEFSKQQNHWDGRAYICRQCEKDDLAHRESQKDTADKADKALRKKSSTSKWKSNNKPRLAAAENERKRTNIQYKIASVLRSRIRSALKGNYKSVSSEELLGCTVNELKIYLERKFESGMTWENHGEIWHIDHKLPCKAFDLTVETEQRICFHFTNLQPLKCFDNLSKHAKITHPQMSLSL